MNTATPTLATRFSRNTVSICSDNPLAEDQMRRVAPSIFAAGKHASRSERYAYIPTIDVLRGLRREGFEPFMVAQGGSRVAGKAEFTKHMVRLRHVRGTEQGRSRSEAHEIILINSHDGASAYQMMSGMFRYVCTNGLVVGEAANDIRVPHKGSVQHDVIDGAFKVLDDFAKIDATADAIKAMELKPEEERAFATAALALRFGERAEGLPPAPVTADQLLTAYRPEDIDHSLWTTFQRVQANTLNGGLRGRGVQGQRVTTRAVASIDRSVSLNRALWLLAEEMRRIKG